MILANGGWVQKHDGVLWFLLAPDTMDLIEKATGERPPEAVEARIRFCNKTPGTVPVLGDFEDPERGLWCFLELPREWNDAWRGYT